jgi:HAE1 family hydrophobic/amphiphilic exporter-1
VIISDVAIKRPIVTIVAMLILVVFGIFALTRLEVDEFPDIAAPVVSVAIPYPGAAPGQVERDVIEPLEEQIGSISGVDEIRSTSIDGFGTLVVIFVFGKSPDQASQDVRDAISAVRGELPQEMEEPILRKFDPNDLPIVSLALSSQAVDPGELTRMADPDMTKELRGIPGVAQVTVVGGIEREISVNLRPEALAATGISVAEVVQALQAQNLSTPVGRVTGAISEESIRLRGRLETPAEFRDVIVRARGDRLVRLGDVADVADATAEPRSAALLDGQPAVGIDITKAKGASTTTVADAIKARVAQIEKGLPPTVALRVTKDAGSRVRNSVLNVEEALIEGALLTVLVVFLFLNSWRSTVITGLALPVSVLAAFIPVLAFGFTLNTMSLMGLSLAIGILIDDAIVVRENIVRHVEMGEDHVTASHRGTDEIGLAVTATTLSIVAVFVPVGFMGGLAGQWFKPFALTIASAVLVSLFVSFSLDPMLSAYWPDPHDPGRKKNALTRALDRFNAWFDRGADRYAAVARWSLDHRWTVMAIIAASFVGALVLQATLGGSGFSPDSDRGEITMAVKTPPGSSLEYTRLKAEETAAAARAHPEVQYTYTSIGGSQGAGSVDQGQVYVKLRPRSERSLSQQELAAVLREELRRLAGVEAYVTSGGMGGADKQLQVQVLGDDLTALAAAAEQVKTEVMRVPGAVDVGLSTRGNKPELEVTLRRGLTASLGLSVSQIAMALRTAFAGIDAGDWVDPSGKTRDVTVRLSPTERVRQENLETLPIPVGAAAPSAEGAPARPATVPLRQIAEVRPSAGPAQIDHLDREKIVTVGANIQGRSLGEVSRDIAARLQGVTLPAGVRVSLGGEVEDQGEVFGGIFAALALAVLLMYFILVIQFESFLDPVAILVSLPLSLIGVVLTLLLTGDTLNIMSLIGVMLLMGIVAKNAILLIDFAKWNHEAGLPLREALVQAGRIRMRPIIMTTLALIAGMVPVALGLGEGADFRAPLGRAVIGGTITSTVLTLLVIPTVYETLVELRQSLGRRLRGGKTPPAAPPPPPGPGDREPEPELALTR